MLVHITASAESEILVHNLHGCSKSHTIRWEGCEGFKSFTSSVIIKSCLKHPQKSSYTSSIHNLLPLCVCTHIIFSSMQEVFWPTSKILEKKTWGGNTPHMPIHLVVGNFLQIPNTIYGHHNTLSMKMKRNLNYNQFEGNLTMSAVITLWELLTKCQTITYITNSSGELPLTEVISS